MDTVKIGSFLRELRKEKSLTQEQLAEVFGVSARTVSRWETGSNMPDISILVEIADYYELDVREILNGERETMTSPSLLQSKEGSSEQSEDFPERKENESETDSTQNDPPQMNFPQSDSEKKESSDVLKELAEFADKEKEKMAVRTRIYMLLGIAGILVFNVIRSFGPADNLICILIASLSMIFVYAALFSGLIYTSERLQTLQRNIKSKVRKNLLLIILAVLGGIILLVTLFPVFMVGAAG